MKPEEIERPLTPDEEQFLRNCFSTRQWRWATTMKGIPHEYIVRASCKLRYSTFDRIVVLQRECGKHERWGNYNFPYVYVDGYKYWTMGSDVEETIIINRQRIFNIYDSVAETYDQKMACQRRNDLSKRVEEYLWGALQYANHVLDIGCGTGHFLDMFEAEPNMYVGVDPSMAMLSKLAMKHEGYANSICNKAFEELVKVPSYSLAVGLYGSPSYIMKQYTPRIRQYATRYFLMYFMPDVSNVVFDQLQQKFFPLNYTKEELNGIFPGALITEDDGFYIVTNFNEKGELV